MTKICISGIKGFIGSNVAERLCKKYDVIGIDNLQTGHDDNTLKFESNFDFVYGDCRNIEQCFKVVNDSDVVVHLAAIPSVPRSIQNPHLTNDCGVNATLNMLRVAKEANVDLFINTSSSSVYGDTIKLPKREDMLLQPNSPYAASKIACEAYSRSFNKSYGLNTISMRPFNIFGKNQDPLSQYSAVIPKFIHSLERNVNINIHGKGDTSRDFTHVDNVVHMIELLVRNRHKNFNGESVNLACGKRYTLNYLVERLMNISGKEVNVIHDKERIGDVKHSLADISKAKKLIGYKPIMNFDAGLKKTYKFYEGLT